MAENGDIELNEFTEEQFLKDTIQYVKTTKSLKLPNTIGNLVHLYNSMGYSLSSVDAETAFDYLTQWILLNGIGIPTSDDTSNEHPIKEREIIFLKKIAEENDILEFAKTTDEISVSTWDEIALLNQKDLDKFTGSLLGIIYPYLKDNFFVLAEVEAILNKTDYSEILAEILRSVSFVFINLRSEEANNKEIRQSVYNTIISNNFTQYWNKIKEESIVSSKREYIQGKALEKAKHSYNDARLVIEDLVDKYNDFFEGTEFHMFLWKSTDALDYLVQWILFKTVIRSSNSFNAEEANFINKITENGDILDEYRNNGVNIRWEEMPDYPLDFINKLGEFMDESGNLVYNYVADNLFRMYIVEKELNTNEYSIRLKKDFIAITKVFSEISTAKNPKLGELSVDEIFVHNWNYFLHN